MPVSSIPPIVCYCLASILMTVMNKFVVSGSQFTMTFLLLTIQSSVCVLCVSVVKKLGIISFRNFSWQDAKIWWPVSTMLVGVIYTGSKSLQFLSIPVYTIFKNLTIILIAYGEVIWFGGRVTALTFVSFVFMVLSSIIAASADLAFFGDSVPTTFGDLPSFESVATAVGRMNLGPGYFWMLTNCLMSAAYVLSMRKKIKATGFSDWDSMFYSNLLSVPVLVVFSFVVEDWGWESLERNFPTATRTFLLSAIAFSGAAAVGISYTTAWCVRATSSTTYSMVGALNKLPVAASGMIFFRETTPVTFGSVSAIAVGFFAGVLYAVAKANNNKAAAGGAPRDGIIPLANMNRDRKS